MKHAGLIGCLVMGFFSGVVSGLGYPVEGAVALCATAGALGYFYGSRLGG